jgi:cbb3-type cytochrome oxidase subunit 3
LQVVGRADFFIIVLLIPVYVYKERKKERNERAKEGSKKGRIEN